MLFPDELDFVVVLLYCHRGIVSCVLKSLE